VWYGGSLWASLWAWALAPFSIIFALLSGARRWSFRVGLARSVRVGKPVIVIGNITVGGTGKTPLVIWLARELAKRGFTPAVITRGYGGASTQWPVRVTADSDPRIVGDEAVLIAQRCDVVVAGPDRVADAQMAIALGADVIVSDDGLQHYRLARDVEIAVVDGARVFGNGRLLPAGPLRETTQRLDQVTAVMVTSRNGKPQLDALVAWQPLVAHNRIRMAVSLLTREQRPLVEFTGAVHAIAGIGNPAAFFDSLAEHGLQVNGRALPDHAQITAVDLEFSDAAPVFMTEKDAVKCRALADSRMWVVPIELEIDADRLLVKIEAIIRVHKL
jgi:tetraacyldisaccharide 4'-kinase